MKRFDRLRKIARMHATAMGHSLGWWNKKDSIFEAKCIYCLKSVMILDNPEIQVNQGKIPFVFNNPHDLSSIRSRFLNQKHSGPKQTGYVFGEILIKLCKDNPFLPNT